LVWLRPPAKNCRNWREIWELFREHQMIEQSKHAVRRTNLAREHDLSDLRRRRHERQLSCASPIGIPENKWVVLRHWHETAFVIPELEKWPSRWPIQYANNFVNYRRTCRYSNKALRLMKCSLNAAVKGIEFSEMAFVYRNDVGMSYRISVFTCICTPLF